LTGLRPEEAAVLAILRVRLGREVSRRKSSRRKSTRHEASRIKRRPGAVRPSSAGRELQV
jgi:hypothetical protein